MKNVLAIVAVAGIAAAANAQVTGAHVVWEVSTDGGATWSSAAIVGGGSVKIRGSVVAARGPQTPNAALAAINFDGSVAGSLAESGSGLVKPLVQGLGAQAGSVVNLGGGNMRFSRTTDSGLAGSNTNYWTVGQDANLDTDGDGVPDSFPGQVSSNPTVFVMWDMAIDASANHIMSVGSVLNSGTTSSTAALRFYTNNPAAGASVLLFRQDVLVDNALITVLVPTPGSLALLGLGGLAAARRRR
eukprot:TRINITY_DN19171_c0_g1_i1.p1 TRINITY_DN19171_c0_g1~~TRINITY_DN19171_c0_g1_i1.p1  ORF type:complete len:244 (-),score=51.06 TRINITY_DN19171_c0_g1_i1:45-776(-)